MKPDRCDSRPRIWITPTPTGASWRLHPSARPHPTITPGAALDRALDELGAEAGRGVVVILEPVL